MHFPESFDAAPRISVRDPLGRFLGAADDGATEYAYADAVKLAGHSCPTVASAYRLRRAGLVAAVNLFSGQRAWLLQRLSSIALLAAVLGGLLMAYQLPVLDFTRWRSLAASSTGATLILVGYVAACVHAWIGARDIALDYVPHKSLRLMLLTVVGLVLIATPIRVLFVLQRLA